MDRIIVKYVGGWEGWGVNTAVSIPVGKTLRWRGGHISALPRFAGKALGTPEQPLPAQAMWQSHNCAFLATSTKAEEGKYFTCKRSGHSCKRFTKQPRSKQAAKLRADVIEQLGAT
jgi:hypothetical protein